MCVHFYLCDSPDGPTAWARCRKCGAVQEFVTGCADEYTGCRFATVLPKAEILKTYEQPWTAATASDTTWGGTVSGDTWIAATSPDAWPQFLREMEAIDRYNTSRAWRPAPRVIEPRHEFVRHGFLWHRKHSVRFWTGKNFKAGR